MPHAIVRKTQAKRSIADWLVINVLTWLPKRRRAKSRTTKTTALAHVPVTPVTSPTTIDAIGNAGGPGNGVGVCDVFSTLLSVVNSLASAMIPADPKCVELEKC